MKSIVLTYPGFQALPRGLKQLLVASESYFFREVQPSTRANRSRQLAPVPARQLQPVPKLFDPVRFFGALWRN
jgi:hypothetical protein